MKPSESPSNVIAFPPKRARPPSLTRRRRPRSIIAVGGGKGGIGKTLVSVNLGLGLARRGHRVVLVDADLGGANLHTCLGMAPPAVTLSDFISRKVTSLADTMVPAGYPNLSLIAGGQDTLDAANPRYQEKTKLLRHIQALDVDTVILDLGAGTTFNVLDFFLVADHGLVVLLPEPTSVENAYRFIKAAFFRKLQDLSHAYGVSDLVAAAASAREGLRTPADLLARVKARDLSLGERLQSELQAFTACLVVNQARTPADMEVGRAVVSAWKKFFGLDLSFLGAVPHDDEAWRAVRRRRPVLAEQPHSAVAEGLNRVLDGLLALRDVDDEHVHS